MCWNQSISINTFVFGCLALGFIYFTNTFTKYKTNGFDNPFIYLIIFSFLIMQLVEFFIWRNLNNKQINRVLSIVGFSILLFQPITLMLYDTYYIGNITTLIQNLSLYIIAWISFLSYKYLYNPISFTTTIGVNKHLKWNWLNFTTNETIVCILLYFSYIVYSLFILKNVDDILKYVFFVSLFISIFSYFNTNEFGSIWCWVVNVYLLILIVNILIVKPFYDAPSSFSKIFCKMS